MCEHNIPSQALLTCFQYPHIDHTAANRAQGNSTFDLLLRRCPSFHIQANFLHDDSLYVYGSNAFLWRSSQVHMVARMEGVHEAHTCTRASLSSVACRSAFVSVSAARLSSAACLCRARSSCCALWRSCSTLAIFSSSCCLSL